jgi:hypothetical protein
MRRMECILGTSIAAALSTAAMVFAQTPATSTLPATQSGPAASSVQSPAMPAVLSLTGGQLTIQAKNSSLRSILDRLQAMTGARIEGLSTDERIFGIYGPGDPQKVLAELLDSSKYNVLIAGRRPDGAPREIVLSTPSALPTQTAVDQRSQDENGDDAPDNSGYADMPTPAPMPSPQGRPGTEQPRTAQQMLQELQRMRQQAIPGNGPDQ